MGTSTESKLKTFFNYLAATLILGLMGLTWWGWMGYMNRKPVQPAPVREVLVPDPVALTAAAAAYAESVARPDPEKAVVKMGIAQKSGNLVSTIHCKPDNADEYWIDEVIDGSCLVLVLRNKNGVVGIAMGR
jgi:hypothetical protein